MTVGWKNKEAKIVLLASLGVLLIFLSVGFNYYENKKLISNQKLLGEQVRFRNNMNDVVIQTLLLESQVRNLVITENPEFSENIENEFAIFFNHLDELSKESESHPESRGLIDSLTQLIERKVQFTRSVLTLYNSHGKEQAEKLISGGIGIKLSENINAVQSILEAHESVNILENEKKIEAQIQTKAIFQDYFPALELLVFIGIGVLLFRSEKKNQLVKKTNWVIEDSKSNHPLNEQFISNISHEIRTPLNSVIGYSSLLQKTALNEEQNKFVHAIQSSGQTLLYIINELLDYGKIEEGLIDIKKEVFHLPDLLEQVTLIFKESFKKKDIAFTVSIDPTLGKVVGDEVKVRQVLVNLINNALKFTETGTVDVHIKLLNVIDNISVIELKVRDTGIGIVPEKLSRIFDRFYQIEDVEGRQHGGTGLGLSIIKKLLELMNGNISVTSEVGKGTQFTVIIPFTIPEKTEARKFKVALNGATSTPKKILIVDDNSLNRELTLQVITSWNFDAIAVENGASAMEKLSTEKYDLLLTDVQMPGMDGYTLAKKIRSELNSSIPIVALTAHSDKNERAKCIGAGMNEYLSKPFKEMELFDTLARLLTKSSKGMVKSDYLKSLSNGNLEFEKKILKRFVEESRAQIRQMHSAIHTSDLEKVRRIMHDMKGNAGIVGIEQKLEIPHLKMKNFGPTTDNKEWWAQYEIIRETLNQTIEEINQDLA